MRILDDDGAVVPAGQVGRIFVGASALFDGYTGGDTKEMVRGLLSAGDVGHFDGDGLLFIDGRDDDMIVSGGENVFPAELEDERFGQRLDAFIVRRPEATLTAKAVKDHVRSHLARFKVPGRVHFVDALPRTTTGKLHRRDLS